MIASIGCVDTTHHADWPLVFGTATEFFPNTITRFSRKWNYKSVYYKACTLLVLVPANAPEICCRERDAKSPMDTGFQTLPESMLEEKSSRINGGTQNKWGFENMSGSVRD